MPLDSQAFITEWKGQTIDGWLLNDSLNDVSSDNYMEAIVEQVRDGTTLRVRLFLPDNVHQFANVALAGVRSAKASTKQGESAEPWGEEVSCLCLYLSTSLI